MPRNLDDFELERTPYAPKDDPEPSPAPGQPEEPPLAEETPEPTRYVIDDDTEISPAPPAPVSESRRFPLLLALLAVVAFAILAGVYFAFRPAGSRPVPAATAPAPVAGAGEGLAEAPASAPQPAEDLPPLAESDAYVRQRAAALSSHPELARWLAQGSLVPTLAAVVTNVMDGETPRPHLGFLAPRQGFRVRPGPNGRTVPDPAGFAGYDRFADAVSSIDATRAVAEYRRLEPLFDAAYRELGHPQGGFTRAVDRAMAALLAVPILDGDVALVPHAVGFKYADARLEQLTPAQKQFLRMGPRNVQKVQAALREARAALAVAEPLPSTSQR